ncbi:DNA gyrase inhibitor YacG [Aliiruegeria haliotis]|uniref:DNA gyrase inhibitor YacG n=1 Tax=Aliiruegeria haliotis TaxID=1280846 RepID=UPI000D05764A|nr:DNA gyrase inhibitor YacG [Aliiruegeria haliotis]
MSCPICSKDPEPRYRPFCSKRCADVDLGRWMQGKYAIATEERPVVDGASDEFDDAARKFH